MGSSLYERILDVICSVFDAYTAVLFLRDPGQAEPSYSIMAAFSLGSKVDRTVRLREGQGLVGWIIRNRAPLLVPQFDQGRSRLGYYLDNEEKNVKAFMGIPLPDGSGVLCVDSKRQYSFSEKDQKMLDLFAKLIASVYASQSVSAMQSDALRYYAALRMIYILRREHSRWSDFLNSFLDIVSKESGFEYCALCTRQPDGQSFAVEGENYPLLLKGKGAKSYDIQRGMIGWVFRYASPLYHEPGSNSPYGPLLSRSEDAPQFQTVMNLPLLIQGKVRAVLCLASKAPAPIEQDLKDFTRMASEHLALFLENLYIKCRFRELHAILAQQNQAQS